MPLTAQVVFTLDGRTLTSPEAHTTAAAILRLGGLDPAGYDLAAVRPGHAEPQKLPDDHPVELHEGDAFLSVRQTAPVA